MTVAARLWNEIVPLENGAHLSAQEFFERYQASDPSLKAELIDGVVYVASPVSLRHGDPHAHVVGWLVSYAAGNSSVRVSDNNGRPSLNLSRSGSVERRAEPVADRVLEDGKWIGPAHT